MWWSIAARNPSRTRPSGVMKSSLASNASSIRAVLDIRRDEPEAQGRGGRRERPVPWTHPRGARFAADQLRAGGGWSIAWSVPRQSSQAAAALVVTP